MGSYRQTIRGIMMKNIYLVLCLLVLLPILSSGRDQRAIQLSLGKIQHPLKRVASLSPNKPEMHPLKGDVFYRLDDDSVITISNFYYPSPGPDAFFWLEKLGSVMWIPSGKDHILSLLEKLEHVTTPVLTSRFFQHTMEIRRTSFLDYQRES